MTAGSSDQETHKSDLSDTEKGKGLPAGRPGQETDMAAATLVSPLPVPSSPVPCPLFLLFLIY
jgi:hypothetical protein